MPRSCRKVALQVVIGLLAFAFYAIPHAAFSAQPTIVLIGGKKQGYGSGEHDYPDGVLRLERLLKASPQVAQSEAKIKAFPAGFPRNLAEMDDASVIVLYFGLDYRAGNQHPLDNAEARQEMAKLMARGVGLVALHQAFTVADKTSEVPFREWLGAIRVGMPDRTTEIAPLQIAGAGHPIANGLQPFDYHDEFYPTIAFSDQAKITPILSARVHVQHRGNAAVFEEPAKPHVAAWATERRNGGRAFGFTGAHYLSALDQQQIRTMVLNAILWTAKIPVPPAGATSVAPDTSLVVLPAAKATSEVQPWGRLQWFASRALGNSTKITVGRATIAVGQANPAHWHPNCDEVLHVRQGHIMHRVGDKEYEMRAGDTVTIPEGTLHNARNIGTEDAILEVSFSSADRVAIGE